MIKSSLGFIGLGLLLLSCNSENAWDCLQNSGDSMRVEVEVPPFETITVFENLNLVLKQGDTQRVEVESGEFLIPDISTTVQDGRLVLKNDNGCNILREYGLSTVYVTSPNINEVRSSTGGVVRSEGTLAYAELSLLSESFTVPESDTTDGSFDLDVEASTVRLVTNGIAYIKLRGSTNQFNISIAAGDARVEAEALVSQNVNVDHRGTNDLIVNPQQRISGQIRGYGDVICVNRPNEVAVDELFNGRLIFSP